MSDSDDDLAPVRRCPECFSELRPGTNRCLSCGATVHGGGGGGGGGGKAATGPPPVTGRKHSDPNVSLSPVPTRRDDSASPSPGGPPSLPHVSAAPKAVLPRRASIHDEVIGEEEMAKILQVCTEVHNSLVWPKRATSEVPYVDVRNPPRRLLAQGELHKKSTKALIRRNSPRTIFLFKDLIIVSALPDARGKRKVSAVLNLPICELFDPFSKDGADVCSFEIVDPSSRSVMLVAKDTKEKRHWLYTIGEAIMAHMDPYETGAHVGFVHTLIRGSVFEAAVKGQKDNMARYLTHKMCEPNQKDHTGRCPIHYVVELEHVNVLRVMLLAGKSGKNVDLSVVDGDGRRAMDIAIDHLNVELLEQFFKAGMGVVRASLVQAMSVFAKLEEITPREADFMATLFTRAGRLLVRKNDTEAGTLLHEAAAVTGPSADKMVVFLLKRGCDPNAIRPCDEDRPLHSAGLACNAVVAEELLKAGAQPNAKEFRGNSVLHLMYNVKGTPPDKFPPLDTLLTDTTGPRVDTVFVMARYGVRFDIPNNAGVTAAVGVGDKVMRLVAPHQKVWAELKEPPSAANWSKMFPCEPFTSWEDDDKLPDCQLCGRRFDIMRPKKRCNFCARLVCIECSKKKFTLQLDGRLAPRRVDDGCFNFLRNRSLTLDRDPELVKRMQAKWGAAAAKEGAVASRKQFLVAADRTKSFQDAQWAKDKKKRGLFAPRPGRSASDATAVYGGRRHTTAEPPARFPGRTNRASSDGGTGGGRARSGSGGLGTRK